MKESKLKTILFLSLVLLPTYSFAEPAPGAKIGLIHMQEAIQSVAEGKKAQATLKKEWEDKQKKLQAEGKKVQEAMESLRKQAMVMDEKSRGEKEMAIQKQVENFRQMEQSAQQEFQKKDQEISEPIIKKIRTLVAAIAKEKGYALVIDGNEGNVIYSLDQDNITGEVIKRYDKK